MASIFPFRPYRYTAAAGPLENLVTQPYDKISPEMRNRYLALSPHNLVRIILGERYPADTDSENVYTRAASHFETWSRDGVLAQDAEPGLFVYSQEFCVPDSGEKAVRMGFIGLGAVEDYSNGVVHRHEQTLSGPKKDRLELLRHARAHFGQIFMLYPDPAREIDSILDEVAHSEPLAAVSDEYGTVHRLWRIGQGPQTDRIRQLMADKKLLIADGHHRYETALAFRNENPGLADAGRVMMTFVNMHSPGLKILATHRLVRGLEGFRTTDFLARLQPAFRVKSFDSRDALRNAMSAGSADQVRIGLAAADAPDTFFLLETARSNGALDLDVLHRTILGEALGIGEEAVRSESHLRYVRGMDAAIEAVRRDEAQLGFLLEPVSIEEVARTAFSGGVMPQKSTDFYPKLLSGLTIYKLER